MTTALLTGATSGLGRYLAEQLAASGIRVLVHGRDRQRTEDLAAELRKAGGEAEPYVADLASLAEVRRLAAEVAADHPRLDHLINNAGIGFNVPDRPTVDGHQPHWAVNYLAPYLLARSLVPALTAAAPARIVNVGSIGQVALDFDDPMVRSGDHTIAYRRSKLALAMFTFDLAEELRDSGVTVVCLHPATFMDTGMVRDAGISPHNTVEHGGKATMRVILDPELAAMTGVFFDEDRPARAHPDAYDPALRAKLHELTEAQLHP